MPEQNKQWVPIGSGALSAQIDPLGAQLSTLRDRKGLDLLWDGNPSVWTGRAPLLFPIVGALEGGRYRLGSKVYPLSRHGFARGKLFDLVDCSATAASFRLGSDEASLQVYPFRFELQVSFTVSDATLTITARVRNAGDTDMPASFGFHPAFRWPLPYGRARAAHFIEFTDDEPAPVRRLDAQGLLTAEPHPTPIVNRRLALADALFKNDVVIFDRVHSRAVSYGAVDGPRIRVSYPDAPYLGVWTKPHDAGFMCIEPWHGVADPAGFSGDFTTKPGVFIVAPGATVPVTMAITLLDP